MNVTTHVYKNKLLVEVIITPDDKDLVPEKVFTADRDLRVLTVNDSGRGRYILYIKPPSAPNPIILGDSICVPHCHTAFTDISLQAGAEIWIASTPDTASRIAISMIDIDAAQLHDPPKERA